MQLNSESLYFNQNFISKEMLLGILIILLSIILGSCSQVVQILQVNLLQTQASIAESSDLGDDITQHSLFITLVVLLSFNFVVFLLICCCRNPVKFNIDFSQTKRENARYLHISSFQTNTYCLIESETIPREKCFEMTDTLTELPAYIYSRQIEEQVNMVGLVAINQCERCRGMTKTIEIIKYGKLRQCWQTLFMLVISPCFLAFTIKMIVSNNILWRKFFCGECGREKRKSDLK